MNTAPNTAPNKAMNTPTNTAPNTAMNTQPIRRSSEKCDVTTFIFQVIRMTSTMRLYSTLSVSALLHQFSTRNLIWVNTSLRDNFRIPFLVVRATPVTSHTSLHHSTNHPLIGLSTVPHFLPQDIILLSHKLKHAQSQTTHPQHTHMAPISPTTMHIIRSPIIDRTRMTSVVEKLKHVPSSFNHNPQHTHMAPISQSNPNSTTIHTTRSPIIASEGDQSIQPQPKPHNSHTTAPTLRRNQIKSDNPAQSFRTHDEPSGHLHHLRHTTSITPNIND